jgi:flagellar biosynthesis/type III secretory pathway protein FliH
MLYVRYIHFTKEKRSLFIRDKPNLSSGGCYLKTMAAIVQLQIKVSGRELEGLSAKTN